MRLTAEAPGPPPRVAPPGADRFWLHLRATPLEVRRTLIRIRRHFETGLAPGDSLDVAETVLAEVLNNICEHAYPAEAPGGIDLRLMRQGDTLGIEVRDNGVGMPGADLPAGTLPAADSLPPEGGFGWFLIRTLAEAVQYSRQGAENRLRLRVSLREGQDA